MSVDEMQGYSNSKAIKKKLRRSASLKISSQQSLGPRNRSLANGRKAKLVCSKDDLQCICQKQSLENYSALKKILPEDYDYRVCSFSQDGDGFKAVLRLPYLSPDKAQEWKTCLENVSYCIFRVSRTFPGSGRYNVFKMDYACQHNTSRGAGKVTSKKTGCKAELSVTVKRVVKKSRSRDKHLPEYPTCIFIRWCHNHSLDEDHSMKYRDVGEASMKEFIALYHRGYSPAAAYRFFKTHLMNEWGRNFERVSKDRHILPEKQFVYRLFAKLKKKTAEPASLSALSTDPVFDALCRNLEMDVILPAAGSSTRMGGSGPRKPFIKVLGSHVIAYTIDCFHRVPWVRHIVLVLSADQMESAKSLIQSYGFTKVKVCEGSHARHRSIYCGVQALRNECDESSLIIIHDGARPFVSEDIIEKVATAAERHGAAGVVRPLVSTVIKGNEKGILETALKRSDYRNSEMPQGFRYGIIAGAYEKCSEEDFDFGTECLLLALKYSNCAAEMVEGNDDLWKVTYQKDLPLMETTVKVKFTTLSLIQKSSQTLECLEQLQSSLLAKGLKIVPCDGDGANTIICFLDLPHDLTTASYTGQACGKLFEDLYSRLPNSVSKLNLMVIAVFVRTNHVRSDASSKSSEFQRYNSITSISSPSSNSFTSSLQLMTSLPIPPHQQHHCSQSISSDYPLSSAHQHPYDQQQPHQFHQQGIPGDTPQNASCSQNLQQHQLIQPFTFRNQYHHSGNSDFYHPLPNSVDSRTLPSSMGTQPGLSYPPPQPAPLTHLLSSHLSPSLGLTSLSSSSTSFDIPPHHQPVTTCQEISFSGMQSPQTLFESHAVLSKDTVTDKVGSVKALDQSPGKASDRSAFSAIQRSSTSAKGEPIMSNKASEMDLSRRSLTSMEEVMRKSNLPFCILGVLCENGSDVGDQLVDIVWGRNQFLNGQILSFL